MDGLVSVDLNLYDYVDILLQGTLAIVSLSPSITTQSVINSNWNRVCEQVAQASLLSGREPSQIKIVGVAKYVGPEFTAQLVDAGCSLIGENRPQSLWKKVEWFEEQRSDLASSVQWHLIGHLQRNKVRRTLPLVDMIQSVDSLRLARELSDEAIQLGITARILLDVNVTQDTTKTGFTVDRLRCDLQALAELPNIELCGLMAMSSLDADAREVRREFAAVRELRDQLAGHLNNPASFVELSMGMSGDFEEAIAEGSTCVRIGSNLWTGIIS